MKYLITGGAGFIGSHIARALLGQGESVRILDNFSSGKRENFFRRVLLWAGGTRENSRAAVGCVGA